MAKPSSLKFCIITDGGQQLGMGHVQQSITLANLLCDKGEVIFFTKSGQMVLTAIRRNGFLATHFHSDNDILAQLIIENPNVVIFDKLDVSEQFALDIKLQLNARLAIFTNLTQANQYADVSVLQRSVDLFTDVSLRFKNIRTTSNNPKRCSFSGPRYWILRPEFYKPYPIIKKSDPGPKRILLFFGGSDPSNFTCSALSILSHSRRNYKIDIILGPCFAYKKQVRNIANNCEPGVAISIYENVTNVAYIMLQTDLVITSAGISMFEALRLGRPVLVIPQDELQKQTYEGLIQMVNPSELHKLLSILDQRDFTFGNDPRIVDLQIGQGFQELVHELLC